MNEEFREIMMMMMTKKWAARKKEQQMFAAMAEGTRNSPLRKEENQQMSWLTGCQQQQVRWDQYVDDGEGQRRRKKKKRTCSKPDTRTPH